MRVLQVAPGPAGHGVVRHAADLEQALRAAGHDTGGRNPDLVHAHFTDALWGPNVAAAARAFGAWAARLDVPLVVSLHDVPGIDPDPARDARRAAGYREVVAAASAVVVCDAREVGDVRRWSGAVAAAVPLPVPALPPPGPVPAWAGRPSLGVLGFLYPGKGHEAAVRAAAGTGALVVAAGAPSPGCDGLVADLTALADRLGVGLHVTGTLSDADLHAAARAVTVPLAAYTTLGASASLATWSAAGRRPLASPTPHARALATTDPGRVLLLDGPLDAAVRAALADPAPTWAAGPPAAPDVARLLGAVYATLLGARA